MITRPRTPQGTSRASLALFAASTFCMLSALVFLAPFAVSPRAGQHDVYMVNLVIALPLFFAGSLLFAISLAGLGLRPGLAVLVTLACHLVGVMLWLGSVNWSLATYTYVAGCATMILLVLSWVVAFDHHRLGIWRRGLMLALGGSGAVALLYLLFGGHYTSTGGVAGSWPPYLTLPIVAVAIGLAAAIFVLGWLWDARGLRQETPMPRPSSTGELLMRSLFRLAQTWPKSDGSAPMVRR